MVHNRTGQPLTLLDESGAFGTFRPLPPAEEWSVGLFSPPGAEGVKALLHARIDGNDLRSDPVTLQVLQPQHVSVRNSAGAEVWHAKMGFPLAKCPFNPPLDGVGEHRSGC